MARAPQSEAAQLIKENSVDTNEPLPMLTPLDFGHGSIGRISETAVQIERQEENERLRLTREYFEDGCACIHRAKTLQPCPTNMADADAVAFYEQHCKCSRNYIQS
jgi:hypothetical protein